jgi:Zn-finger nucleic acid-binding protein
VSLSCPRCRVNLREIMVGEVQVDLCPECDGAWYDGDELERLLKAPYAVLAASDLAVGLIRDVQPPDDQAPPLPCPRCQGPMERKAFLEGCPVVIDGCAAHGIWLDDGELSSLFEFSKRA